MAVYIGSILWFLLAVFCARLHGRGVSGFQKAAMDHSLVEDKLRLDRTSPGISCGETREIGLHEAVFMESPNYSQGKKYPNSITCKWNFHLKKCTLAITCPNFDLNKFLCFDYLDVSDGIGRSKRFCGNEGPQSLYMQEKVQVVFRSSPSFSATGFRCYAVCVSEGPVVHTELALPSIPFTSVGMCACGKRPKSVVYGSGRSGMAEELPWVGRVYRNWDHKYLCPATLVSNQYLITASHCFADISKSDQILVMLNERSKEPGLENQRSTSRKVSEIRYYLSQGAKYEPDADVALVKLEEPIDFSKYDDISPVCLPKGEDASKHFVGSPAYLSRWEWDADWHGQHLLTSRSIVLSNDNCSTATNPNDFRYQNRDRKDWVPDVTRTTTLCVKPQSKSCQAVSGAPLMSKEIKGRYAKFTLIGVGTWGSSCVLRTGVNTHRFTRVTELVSWIITNTQDSSFCKS